MSSHGGGGYVGYQKNEDFRFFWSALLRLNGQSFERKILQVWTNIIRDELILKRDENLINLVLNCYFCCYNQMLNR